MNCIFCGRELNSDNVAQEHILLNSLCGYLKSDRIVCSSCNNCFGETIDCEVEKCLYYIPSLLGAKLDRGKVKNIKTGDDEDFFIAPGGRPIPKKPEFKETILDNKKKEIYISANNIKSLRKLFNHIKHKYNLQLSEQDFINSIKYKKENYDEKIGIRSEISTKIFPSIIKTAIEFYYYSTNETETIKNVIEAFNKKNYKSCKFCYADIKNDEICNTIIIQNVKNNVYAYVSYFGVISCIVLLTDEYAGKDIYFSYMYDINNNIECDCCYKLDECDILKNENSNFNTSNLIESFKSNLSKVMKKYQMLSFERGIKEIFDEIIEECLKINDIEIQKNYFIKKFSEKAGVFLISRLKK